jgi:hypothetical protein
MKLTAFAIAGSLEMSSLGDVLMRDTSAAAVCTG